MKFRIIFLALGFLALAAIVAGGAVYLQTVRGAVHAQHLSLAKETSQTVARRVSDIVKSQQNAAAVLADMWSIHALFTKQSTENIAEATLVLNDFQEAYHATRCCLIDRQGKVIAASSAKDAPPLIDEDYSARPFFKNALGGTTSILLSQGVTSQQPALNISHPVVSDETVIGVILLTIPLTEIDQLLADSKGIFALTDAHNLIFASNKKEWLFKVLGETSAEELMTIAQDRQLGGEMPSTIPMRVDKNDGMAMLPDGKEYLVSSSLLQDLPGWRLSYFQEHRNLHAEVFRGLSSKTGIFLACLAIFILGAVIFLYQEAGKLWRDKEQAERKNKAANLFFSQIFNLAADGMRVIDKNFNTVQINNTFAAMAGMEKKAIIGKKCHDVFWGPRCNTEQCPMRLIQAGQKRVEYESVKESPTGKIINCWITAVPFYNENNTFVGILESYRDITERVENELAMEQAMEQAHRFAEDLAASNDLLHQQQQELALAHDTLKQSQAQILQQEKMASVGQLAAGVAHEINNPMGFIASNLSSLAKYLERLTSFIRAQEGKLPQNPPDAELAALRKRLKIDYILEDAAHLVEESLDGAERVKKIVQGLKNFSRIDQAERLPADINECLDTTLNIIWNELKYKCEVKKDYGELPQTVCNPQQLNQMFMNLLINAAQAIETKGEIRIKTWADQDFIYARISDTGCGIPQDKIKRIFEPFYTSKEVGKGTGLGLSIVYDIVVKNHHGDIQVESEVGKGTSFTVKIPVIATPPAGQ